MRIKDTHIIKYRTQYQPPAYWVDSTYLVVELGESETQIESTLEIRRNADPEVKQDPAVKPQDDENMEPQDDENIVSQDDDLVLDGKEQNLKSIELNGKRLTEKDYRVDKESLTVFHVPEKFTLKITAAIKPQENTELLGLYKSGGIFCTQCEPEGFRRITYFIDRPDNLSLYKVKIIGDKTRYPYLLSNGNLIREGDLKDGRHFAVWNDPFKKPCYLFALVAGDLDVLEDQFTTRSGRNVKLQIFSDKGYRDKCRFALDSLKRAMRWDEEVYGREYDLDRFMIVAVSDFNYGAMENKGLNIFNSKYIYVDPKTATDEDYRRVEEVVGHEYFHNWSGNRVTCRDWFQLSLKEGFTVFRDQSFSEDMSSRGVMRIKEAAALRDTQFPEDTGPLAHPVRPDSYIQIDNFYTRTVYEKGAEVIRMMRTLLGQKRFRQGTDLYFKRHDGKAVTCDDFVKAVEDAGGIDLSQFKLWYSQSGTPKLHITDDYDAKKHEYHLSIEQSCPPTPNQPDKKPMHIPLTVGLLDESGKELSDSTQTLSIKKSKQTFTFKNIPSHPTPSLLRYFSAPVKYDYPYSDEALALLAANDTDDFARFNAMQMYFKNQLFALIQMKQDGRPLRLSEEMLSLFKTLLLNKKIDPALKALMLELPSENYLAQFMDTIDVDAIYSARSFTQTEIGNKLQKTLLETYKDNETNEPYQYTKEAAAKRALKNVCMSYLGSAAAGNSRQFVKHQFDIADNMTDQLAALGILTHFECSERKEAFENFYKQWRHEPLVIDKWFAAQAVSLLPNTAERIVELTKHPDFTIKTPNRVYALLVTFAQKNLTHFNDQSGRGYELMGDYVIKIDKRNAMVASRLAKTFSSWRRFDQKRRNLMQTQMQRILKESDLSKDVYEVISKSLG